ncbi:MAG: transglycosylase domain-containing protein [Prevotellaceae bacterium]|jgi:penicillin-binding protein 1A|nr:transglycosylase domain-containing protein [Prevotellaceae bacterium]
MVKKILSVPRKKIIRILWWIIAFPFALLFLLIILISLGVFGPMPSFAELENPKSKLATEIISADGVLLGTFHIENRSHASYEELSQHLIDALIATEDARFHGHSGIDFRSLMRVMVKTVGGGDKRSGGGSTITQQLALNLYSERETNIVKRSIQKLKEWITAIKLERNYTKEEIIAMYFNTVPFGSNAFGIRSAAQTFFGKTPAELNVQESALLVGLVNGPTWYSPVRNPERALDRRNRVISQMHKYGYITQQQKDSISAIPIDMSKYAMQDHNSGLAPHFREMIKRTMYAKKPDKSKYNSAYDYSIDSAQWARDPLYGWRAKNPKADGTTYNLDRDGLRIYTTINAKMQQYAEKAVAEHLSKDVQPAFNKAVKNNRRPPYSNKATEQEVKRSIDRAIKQSDRYRMMKEEGISEREIMESFDKPVDMTVFNWNKSGSIDTTMTPRDSILYYKAQLRASFMAMNPQTGEVLAYVGSPNFRYMKLDHVRQVKRQIGSTVKPFLYTIAMQEGYNPCYTLPNIPYSVPLPNGEVWEPKNSGKPEDIGRIVTLKWALAMSNNWISAWIVSQFGAQALADMSHRVGIKSYIDPVPASSLGSADVSLFEMVSAYATYANKGIHTEPFYVTRIEDNMGNVLATFTQERREAISEQTAYLMINLMQGVVNHGTAGRLRRLYVPEGPVAGKTGTSNDQVDGWFMGTMPKITAGAWVGAEERIIHFEYLSQGGGAATALPIWGLFMQKVLKDGKLGVSSEDRFSIPPGMENFNLNCDDSDLFENNDEDLFR